MPWYTLVLAPVTVLVLIPAFRPDTEPPAIAAKAVSSANRTPSRVSRSAAARPVEVPALAAVRPSLARPKVARALDKPFARPTRLAREVRRETPEPLMVGPEGIVYERIGPESKSEPEPVAVNKPFLWSEMPEAPPRQPEEKPVVEPIPAPREEDAGQAKRSVDGITVGPDGTVFEPMVKSAR